MVIPALLGRQVVGLPNPARDSFRRGTEPSSGWLRHPNLRRRPHAPNKGRGRLQRQIRRAFIAHGNEVSATVIYRWCRRWQAPKLGRLERWSIVRILDVIADRRGRASTIGRPWIWRLKTPAADILSASSDRNH